MSRKYSIRSADAKIAAIVDRYSAPHFFEIVSSEAADWDGLVEAFIAEAPADEKKGLLSKADMNDLADELDERLGEDGRAILGRLTDSRFTEHSLAQEAAYRLGFALGARLGGVR